MLNLEVEQLLQRIRELEEWRRRLILPEADYIPCWDDLQINLNSVKLSDSDPPTWTAYKSSYVLAFSASVSNIIYFTAELPHGYVEGSDIEFHLHLAYPDANAGDSRWDLTYSWVDIDGTFPVASLSGAEIVAPGVADYHQMAEIVAAINGVGKNISSVLLCSLERDGSNPKDTYANDIYLVALDFHVQINSFGSRTETVK